jgi:hypothetical protein
MPTPNAIEAAATEAARVGIRRPSDGLQARRASPIKSSCNIFVFLQAAFHPTDTFLVFIISDADRSMYAKSNINGVWPTSATSLPAGIIGKGIRLWANTDLLPAGHGAGCAAASRPLSSL